MKNILIITVIALTTVLVGGSYSLSEDKDVIFQTSTIGALNAGVYDGDITYKELKKHGDFGLGTFNALDGEMVASDGKFYQIKADGKAYLVDDTAKTPFATVKFFKPDKTILLDETVDCDGLKISLDQSLSTENIFHSIKVEGLFKQVKARSVPRQEKPYPLLEEALQEETVFVLNNVKGIIIGFRMPGYMAGLNVPGYHFHFITEDRKAGGHILGCQIQKAKVEIDYSSDFRLVLPESGEFLEAELGEGNRAGFYETEKDQPQ